MTKHLFSCAEGDPQNYLTYYKRGTVYLALGKAKFALLDFDKALELKEDFTSARLQRGNILLKQAQFDEAEADFLDVVRTHRPVIPGYMDRLRDSLTPL